ncbi:MAG TPA: maltokinase [Streptomyces sp.]|uniref:maltokinase N-terminal cap-like domain-containing protein n=1 Tax=Streptomyces sp. TaxID=1931 RepID=UPI002D6B43AD|nr:maltokinase [Streptomyces sp.]HZG03537.1 maltokinase [Streptomyces sp.]
MSDSSSPRAAVATRESGGAALLRSLTPLLTEWLPRQRWFAGKGRPVSGFALVAATELLPCTSGAAPGLLHLLVRAQQPGGPDQAHPAPADCYQLLLGVRPALPPPLAGSLIGHPEDGPLRGRTVYEALHDPRLAAVLLERLRSPGRLGPLLFQRERGTVIPTGLPPRPLSVEQSNSSVVYGDRYILKLFRRVSPGVNPDLELPLALARAGSDRVPAPAAWFEARPGGEGDDPMTLGVLQPFLPGTSDGWQLALRSLAAHGDFSGAARALGQAIAEVHTTLAQALPVIALRRRQLEFIASGMNERLEAAAASVPALRPYSGRLHAVFDAVAELGRTGRSWPAQRIHGDLHLGQALCAGETDRWSIIDFEGEPARPIAERRRPQPVVRDIAGILRSFDYAACQHARVSPDEAGWARRWAERNRDAYCSGYADASGSDPRDEDVLLRAYETDKAVYEVLYEARHRPAWLAIPMSAIHRLADA